MDLRVVRICNPEIDRDFKGVCDYIDTEVRKVLAETER